MVAAAFALIWTPWLVRRAWEAHNPLRHVREIVRSSAVRPVEGRLDGFAYGRFQAHRGAVSDETSLQLLAEAERLARRGDQPKALHARGVATLLAGDPSRAAGLLRAAATTLPNDSGMWNDLAVAELERTRLGHASALPAALQASARAVALSPSSAPALFNRAIALEYSGRPRDALEVLKQALAHETLPAWRDEIRERIAILQRAG